MIADLSDQVTTLTKEQGEAAAKLKTDLVAFAKKCYLNRPMPEHNHSHARTTDLYTVLCHSVGVEFTYGVRPRGDVSKPWLRNSARSA